MGLSRGVETIHRLYIATTSVLFPFDSHELGCRNKSGDSITISIGRYDRYKKKTPFPMLITLKVSSPLSEHYAITTSLVVLCNRKTVLQLPLDFKAVREG